MLQCWRGKKEGKCLVGCFLNQHKLTRARPPMIFFNPLQELHLQPKLWTPSERQGAIDRSWHFLKETVICATEDAVGHLWEGVVVLEHLLNACLWLLSMKTFFPTFLNGNFRSLGKYECETGHTMSFSLNATEVLLSGFYLIEPPCPFIWCLHFVSYCVL